LAPLCAFLCCTAMLVGFFIVDRFVMPRIVHINRGWVTVPQVAGLEYEAAREKLYGSGLRLLVKDRVYSTTFEQNHVMVQDPAPASRVKTAERRGVEAVVSKGPEVARVPELHNLYELQARRELLKAGFAVGKLTQRYDRKVPKDRFISSIPAPGSMASRETPVAMVVSKGPEPTHAEVPSMVGEALSVAKQRIEEAGLKTGTIETRYASTAQPGMVISQSVPPGRQAALGSTVNLVVSAQSGKSGSEQ
jgi:serine/threonine-protein kinase